MCLSQLNVGVEMRTIDLSGQTFGRLEVIQVVGVDKRGEKIWQCQCSCGVVRNVLSSNLRTGHTKSCGCLDREKSKERNLKHGMYGTPTYSSWSAMIQRCTNKNHVFYHRYGGRGIKIYDSWAVFENFYRDMGEKPEGYTLERLDNAGDYTPSNCVWLLAKDQPRNRETNVEITYNDKTQCISAWEEELGFRHGTLWVRLNTYKWPIERALTEPVKDANRKLITFNEKTQSLAKHARDHGLGDTTVSNRLKAGWTLEEALTTPAGVKKSAGK